MIEGSKEASLPPLQGWNIWRERNRKFKLNDYLRWENIYQVTHDIKSIFNESEHYDGLFIREMAAISALTLEELPDRLILFKVLPSLLIRVHLDN